MRCCKDSMEAEREPTKEEYITASEDRIRNWAKSIEFDLSNGSMWVALHAELKTMYDVGFEKGKTNGNVERG